MLFHIVACSCILLPTLARLHFYVELDKNNAQEEACDLPPMQRAAVQWLLSSSRQVVLVTMDFAHWWHVDFASRLLCVLHRRHWGSASPVSIFHVPYVPAPPRHVAFEDLRPAVRWKSTPKSQATSHIFVAQNVSSLLRYFWTPSVLLPRNYSDMSQYFQSILNEGFKRHPIVHPVSKLLLVVLDTPVDAMKCSYDINSYYALFKTLWFHRGVQNMLIWIKRYTCPDVILSYDPFAFLWKSYGAMFEVPYSDSSYFVKMFERRLLNMNGYKVRASSYITPPDVYIMEHRGKKIMGRNMRVIQTMRDKMNFELLYTRVQWGLNMRIDYCGRIILDLYFNKSDIGIHMCPWILALATGLSPTQAYCELNHLGIIVPKSKTKEPWKLIFLAFNIDVWMYYFLTYTISSICLFVMRRATKNTESIFTSLVDMMKVFVSAAWHDIHERCNLPQRILMTACLLCSSIVLVCAFQASMCKLLTHPPRFPEIETLEDLDKSGLPLLYVDATIPNVFSYGISIGCLKEKMVLDIDERPLRLYLQDLLLTRRGAFLHNRIVLDFGGAYIPEIYSQFHMLRENLFSQFYTLYLREESPYIERFNLLLRRMVESGLVTKWGVDGSVGYAEFARESNGLETNNMRNFRNIENVSAVLGMIHLFPSFLFLFFGFAASFLCLIVEVFLYQLQRKITKGEDLCN